MRIITPTITTDDSHEFREQMERISTFSEGVHIDIADGIFAPTKLIDPSLLWRNDDQITHLHVMYQKPIEILADIQEFQPDLVIAHAEADGVTEFLEKLQESGTRTGIALLAETPVEKLSEFEDLFDHVLVFAGHLGYQGGTADLDVVKKVQQIRKLYPDCEIGWDGGVTIDTISQIASSGVNILNVGGYIKNAEDPKKAYDELTSLIQS